ncbi:MAG TPA: hypothetical protein VFJ90_12905 [Candidatus Didemnitutus sp.]|nr:hypothetical protein [Candidatus Didemnitutus sp.]
MITPRFAHDSRSVAPAAAWPSTPTFAQRLSRLYELAEESDHLFGSPLGPFYDQARTHYLPRFVYFGPHTSQESLRLAVLAGTSPYDLAGARALLTFIEGLALQPNLGQGLNLSFFPLVNVVGLLGGAEDRDLTGENWVRSSESEIRLLGEDARVRNYQGFVRITMTADSEPSALVRTVVSPTVHVTGIELFSSEDFAPWPVRFEALSSGTVTSGPLSIADDLPSAPFEVELACPFDWPQSRIDRAIADVLRRVIVRYRAFHAYGLHL